MEKFFLRRDDALLAVVDIQERLATVMAERERVVANTHRLISAVRLLGVPVFVTEQYPKGLGPTVPEIREALSPYAPIEKISFGCCGEPAFTDALEATGRRQVILCGMETHVCVLQTCIGLLRDGYSVHFVQDAACSRNPGNHRIGTEFMRDAGAVVTGTETALFQLLERAGTAEFREISRLIK